MDRRLLLGVLLLAVAAAILPRIVRRFGQPQRLLAPSLAGAAVTVSVIPLVFLGFGGTGTAEVIYSSTFGEFLGKVSGLTLISLGPDILFCGLTFPLAMAMCSGSGRVAGRKLGLLLAVNGVGGVGGAELARSVLLPSFGPITLTGPGASTPACLSLPVQAARPAQTPSCSAPGHQR